MATPETATPDAALPPSADEAAARADIAPVSAEVDASADDLQTEAAESAAIGDALDAAARQAVAGPTATAARLAEWVAASGDNSGLSYVIIDKLAARIFVFDPDGALMGAAPALVGLAPGDDSAEGIGARALSAIGPDERTTPAGRFVAAFGPAAGHRRVLWVDYANAISLHPVVTTNPKEHRLARMKSQTPEEHRISFGCINVPAGFYRKVVLRAFAGGSGVVYILPDSKPLEEVFPAFAIATGAAVAPSPAAAPSADRAGAPSGEVAGGPPAEPAPAADDSAPGPASAQPLAAAGGDAATR